MQSLEFATAMNRMLSMLDPFKISLSKLLFAPKVFALSMAFLAMSLGAVPLKAQTLDLPKLNIPQQNFAPEKKTVAPVLADPRSVNLSAVLVDDAEVINEGLHWRIFGTEPDNEGKLPLIAESQGGSGAFVLNDGVYFAHVAFGHAGATRKFTVEKEDISETLVLNAGGLILTASLPNDAEITSDALKFSIYEQDEDATGTRPLIAENIQANRIVRLKSGTYHVVSEYGEVNARLRADILVEANRITEATMEHRAAAMSFKLVRSANGQALPGTQWSFYNESGDLLDQQVGPFSSIILAEGVYNIVAQNRDRIFEQSFDVIAGENQEIEILTVTE